MTVIILLLVSCRKKLLGFDNYVPLKHLFKDFLKFCVRGKKENQLLADAMSSTLHALRTKLTHVKCNLGRLCLGHDRWKRY